MTTPARPKRHKHALGCLLAAGVVVACFLGVGQAVRWWTGVVFPGTQFFYSSNSTQDRVFRLTSSIGGKTVRIRIPKDYVSALFPGSYFGYDTIELKLFLPNMVPEQVYDASDPLVAKSYPTIPKEKLLKQLDISLSNSFTGHSDPTGEIGYVTSHIAYAENYEIPLEENPYQSYKAYLFTDRPPLTFPDKQQTWTDYVPKNSNRYYISCLGMPVSESRCGIMFVYSHSIEVDVEIVSENIPNTDMIIKKITALLDNATIVNKH
jgi:hypothetical protein